MSLDHLKKLLGTDIIPNITDKNTKHSAVLVVIYGSEYKIIMTEKPQTMEHHAGEISFPGGKVSSDDSDLLDTAIRESREEISLYISRDNIIGQLRPVTTLNSGFTILPFVAVLEDVHDLEPNSEVEEILHIPAVPFLKTLSIDTDRNHNALLEMYTLSYQDKIVWGASARILKQLADIFTQNKLI